MRIAAHAGANASVLVGLLWCMVLLSLLVVGVLHTARMDLMVVKNYGDQVQAHYLALAGVEKAKALLFQDARDRSRSRVNHNGALYSAADQLRQVRLGRGQFSVFRRGRMDEGGGIVYGVSDEESLLDVNIASAEELGKIENMTPDIVAAIIDWRDSDNQVTEGGAESDYYLSLRPPYEARNGPLQTVRELLMVRGMTPALLLGQDSQPDATSPSLDGQAQVTAADAPERGWGALFTVDSLEDNVDAAGQNRINIQTADESSLSSVEGITPDIARAIVAHRERNRFQSLADLLDVVAAPQQPGRNPGANQGQGQGPQQPGNQPGRNGQQPNPSGPRVISQDLLTEIADSLTIDSQDQIQGAVNINTAGLEVLTCLPGLTRELAQAIISYRSSSGFFPNTACLLKVPGLTVDIYKQLAPRVTARSETFRILSEGKVTSSGARQRVQVIVHIGLDEVKTLSYREDDL